MECSSGAVKTAFDLQVDGKRGPWRPKMTWKQLTERDCRGWLLYLHPNQKSVDDDDVKGNNWIDFYAR